MSIVRAFQGNKGNLLSCIRLRQPYFIKIYTDQALSYIDQKSFYTIFRIKQFYANLCKNY